MQQQASEAPTFDADLGDIDEQPLQADAAASLRSANVRRRFGGHRRAAASGRCSSKPPKRQRSTQIWGTSTSSRFRQMQQQASEAPTFDADLGDIDEQPLQ